MLIVLALPAVCLGQGPSGDSEAAEGPPAPGSILREHDRVADERVPPLEAYEAKRGAGPASAPTGPGHGSVELRIGFYDTGDSGDGNPFLDETETIIEPVVVFDYQVSEHTGVHALVSYDNVSSASIDRLSAFDGQSGASGDNYFGAELGVTHQVTDLLRLGVNASGSVEYDYRSFGGGVNLGLDLDDRNTTIALGVNAFFDQLDLIRFDGSEDGNDDRVSLTVSPTWYQVLSPTVHMSLGYSFTHQSGYLGTPYNAVVLESPTDPPNPHLDNNARGVEVVEVLPDTRIRHALFGQVRTLFNTGTSLGFGSRLYVDDWGITAISGEIRVYQWVVEDRFWLRLRYRYHTQSAADAFEEHFRVPPAERAAFTDNEERTQDSDLGDFNSQTIGLGATWYLGGGHALSVTGDYILRSDGLDQLLFGMGWRWEF